MRKTSTLSSEARIGVMHLTDTLDAGGLERVAVNLVNALPRDRYRTHLCTTRRDGVLDGLVAKDVGRLRLHRRRSVDLNATRRLTAYVREHRIKLLHAHGTALFMARAAASLASGVIVIWHDHYGRYLEQQRNVLLYRLATRGIGGVIAVNEALAAWSRDKLRVARERVWYVPNFVYQEEAVQVAPVLPGTAGGRIVCVANLRPQKDHLNLIRAMQIVRREMSQAHLLLVGGGNDEAYREKIRREIGQRELQAHVSLLGERQDVPAILGACDIGVLSSASEGLPLSLIEYGMARLPAVATDVGQCAEVLDHGRAGLVVPPAMPEALAEALLVLLRNSERAAGLGERLRLRARTMYSADVVTKQISQVYETVLDTAQPTSVVLKGQPDVAG